MLLFQESLLLVIKLKNNLVSNSQEVENVKVSHLLHSRHESSDGSGDLNIDQTKMYYDLKRKEGSENFLEHGEHV